MYSATDTTWLYIDLESRELPFHEDFLSGKVFLTNFLVLGPSIEHKYIGKQENWEKSRHFDKLITPVGLDLQHGILRLKADLALKKTRPLKC